MKKSGKPADLRHFRSQGERMKKMRMFLSITLRNTASNRLHMVYRQFGLGHGLSDFWRSSSFLRLSLFFSPYSFCSLTPKNIFITRLNSIESQPKKVFVVVVEFS